MTPLRQRMINDMTVRGLAENTKRSYLTSVTGLARHYRRSPDHISAQEVQDYLLYLHEQRGLSWKSCNCVRHGVRFLYRITLGVPDPHFYVPGAKTPSTLPEILVRRERRLFLAGANPAQQLSSPAGSPTSPTQRELCRFSLFSTTQVIELLNPCTPNSPQYRL